MSERSAKQGAMDTIRYDTAGVEAIRADLLDTFAYEYPEDEILLELVTDEFTSVCPWSGLPDFGRLCVVYLPGTRCLELKSFKYYLFSYRHVGIYYEHLTQRVLADLVRVVEPRYMRIECTFRERGGIGCRSRAEYRRSGWEPQGPLAFADGRRDAQ